MPRLETLYFGHLEYSPESEYFFPSGIPGFESHTRFVFLDQAGTKPLLFMQSLQQPALCFLLLPILVSDPEYRLVLRPEDREELRLSGHADPRIGGDILCCAVVCADEQTGPTANLMAPIVVNLKERIGMQVIQTTSGYSHRQPVSGSQEMVRCS